jgi:hypothetical protein
VLLISVRDLDAKFVLQMCCDIGHSELIDVAAAMVFLPILLAGLEPTGPSDFTHAKLDLVVK